MVYIEIIAFILFGVVCYLSLKKLLLTKLNQVEDDLHMTLFSVLESKSKELDVKQNTSLISAKQQVSKENELYLSRINEDISKQLEELSKNVKNKRII